MCFWGTFNSADALKVKEDGENKMSKKYQGLTDQQVEESRKKYGSNQIKEAEPETFWQQFMDGFKDPIDPYSLYHCRYHVCHVPDRTE